MFYYSSIFYYNYLLQLNILLQLKIIIAIFLKVKVNKEINLLKLTLFQYIQQHVPHVSFQHMTSIQTTDEILSFLLLIPSLQNQVCMLHSSTSSADPHISGAQ